MKDKNAIAPEIRFEGFTDAWTQRKLGDYFIIISGYAFKMEDYTKTGIPIVNGESIQHGVIASNNWSYLPVEFQRKYSAFLLKTDDIVLGLNRPITNGNLKIAKIPQELNDSLLYQRAGKIDYVQEIDKSFSYFVLETEVKKFVLKEAVGSDQPFISTTKFKDWDFIIPKKDEQTAIGTFFRTLDNAIHSHQQKLNHLRELKKGYLQVMFPQEGEAVPKLRFEGFDGDWHPVKFATLVSRNSKTSDDEAMPRVEFEDIISGFGRLNKDIYAKISGKKGIIFEVGDILFGKLRPYLKNWLLADFTGIAVGDFWVLHPNKTDSKFIYALIQEDTFQTAANLSTGTKMPRSDWNVVSETEFVVPFIEEQATIGTFFCKLDNAIVMQQTKIDQLQLLKAAYLQKMFV
ncbi:MAG: restriction endonuclease subunit S [Defluviitaleaceae bacterium]|nr:restriction endonuclease subunit S [Defluviitaleaceae bacterium]